VPDDGLTLEEPMNKFVNETMTNDQQVDYAWEHRDLFARCRDHNHKVTIARLRFNSKDGRYISGWETNAEQLLIENAAAR
jgi:hypothetical protein